mmetsp:Transcript_38948/g.61628  ORF Transcript_38948/g.61628 Transcript_38948/m.61628 type:complete len:133 (+) Transcript_38948:111-509(+)
MGQQMPKLCLCHAVNAEHLTSCVYGASRLGENELVTTLDNNHYAGQYLTRTPQNYYQPDAAARQERTVRRKLFEEDPMLVLWATQDGCVHEPLLFPRSSSLSSTSNSTQDVFTPPLALRLGLVSPERDGSLS